MSTRPVCGRTRPGVVCAAGLVTAIALMLPGLGTAHAAPNGSALNGRSVFPADNPWNVDISKEPIDPSSDTLIASIGLGKSLHPDFGTTYQGEPNGIPYVLVPGSQPKVAIQSRYADESDPGPYPIPPNAPIEGGTK